jgi:hypothetical protein
VAVDLASLSPGRLRAPAQVAHRALRRSARPCQQAPRAYRAQARHAAGRHRRVVCAAPEARWLPLPAVGRASQTHVHFASLRSPPRTPSTAWTPSVPVRRRCARVPEVQGQDEAPRRGHGGQVHPAHAPTRRRGDRATRPRAGSRTALLEESRAAP